MNKSIDEVKELKREEKIKAKEADIKKTNGSSNENYLAGLELTASLWQENLRTLSAHLDKWVALQRDYINLVTELPEKFPTQAMRVWDGDLEPLSAQTEWLISLQRDYIGMIKGISDKFTKDVLNLNQKNMERAFSAFNDYLSLFER